MESPYGEPFSNVSALIYSKLGFAAQTGAEINKISVKEMIDFFIFLLSSL